jgi:predicted metal-dependent hydrolase
MLHTLKNTEIQYSIRHSTKAKHAHISLKNTAFEVVIPKGLNEDYAHTLALRKKSWMIKNSYILKIEQDNFRPERSLPKDKENVLRIQQDLKKQIMGYVHQYYESLGRPNQLKLKKMTSRWGSLSHKKNMNINWLLAFAPKDVLEYVVVHELCHLTHMNHSKRFWDLVEANFPSYKSTEQWLKKNGKALLSVKLPD